METYATLEMEQMRKELEEEKVKNEQQGKMLIEKDGKITDLQNELKSEHMKNAQSQHLKDVQNEQQRKELLEKEEKIKEIEKEKEKLESQLSDNNLIVNAQRQNIDELQKKQNIKMSSNNESENKNKSPILPSNPNKSTSDANNTHLTNKRHPSVGYRELYSMKAGDRTTMQNFRQSPAPQTHEEETKNLTSPPDLNIENYPPMSARNSQPPVQVQIPPPQTPSRRLPPPHSSSPPSHPPASSNHTPSSSQRFSQNEHGRKKQIVRLYGVCWHYQHYL